MHLRSVQQAPGEIGHVGSSKSTIARLLKKGLEDYSRTDEGTLFSILGLGQSPFCVSGRAAGRVEEQLREHGGNLNFYDLHNAIIYAGTQDSEVPPQYRCLRLADDQLARGRVGVCNECRRLMIIAEPKLN
jgi:hypothetical protein